MKKFYDEGLISKDYFTMDNTQAVAQLTGGNVGVLGEPVYVTGIKTWSDWVAAKPLTSQWNSTPVWDSATSVWVGNFAISAKSKYPEVCLRFADYYFSKDGRIMWIGPKTGSDEAFGVENPNDCATANKWPDGITDTWTYLMKKISPYMSFGTYDTKETAKYYTQDYLGEEYNDKYDLKNPDSQYRYEVSKNLLPYCSETFPSIYYLDDATNTRLTDFNSVVDPYVKEQVARFITGARPLSEFAAFESELKKMGLDDYQKIYQDVWLNYKAQLAKIAK